MIKMISGSQKLQLAIVGVSLFFVMQDGTLLYILLPLIQEDLQITMSQSIWIMNGYIFPFAALMVMMGILAQRIGNSKIFRYGAILFALGSFLGAISSTFSLLLIARIIQGLGSSIIVPVSLVLMLKQYKKEDYTKIIGIWGAIGACAASVGPIAGGLIGQFAQYKLIFYMNFSIFLLVLFLLFLLNRNNEIDPLNTDKLFVLFRKKVLIFAMLVNFLVGFILNSLLFVTPYILSNYVDSLIVIALAILPLCFSIIISALLIRRMEKSFTLLTIIGIGATILLCGLLLLITQVASLRLLAIAGFYLLIGLGLGLVVIGCTSLAIMELHVNYQSFVSSVINMARLIGAVIGSTIASYIYHYYYSAGGLAQGTLAFYLFLLLAALTVILIHLYQFYSQRKKQNLGEIDQKL